MEKYNIENVVENGLNGKSIEEILTEYEKMKNRKVSKKSLSNLKVKDTLEVEYRDFNETGVTIKISSCFGVKIFFEGIEYDKKSIKKLYDKIRTIMKPRHKAFNLYFADHIDYDIKKEDLVRVGLFYAYFPISMLKEFDIKIEYRKHNKSMQRRCIDLTKNKRDL